MRPAFNFTTPTRQNSNTSEHQHSNETVEEHVDGVDDSVHHESTLPEDTLIYLQELLTVPNRHQWTCNLSPEKPQPPNTTWFGRDGSALVRKITKIFTNKFDKAYYSISCVPPERVERWFIEFAKEHTWDPLITGTVQAHFKAIVARRLKDMVSKAHAAGERPTWIGETLWKEMDDYWKSEEGKGRSETASASRNSDRKGLGPHRSITGQKSTSQVRQEMELELGRPVSLGEVFLKTHTKPDGTYVDMKAQKVAETYQQNLQAKRSEFDSEISDGTSRQPELTTEECNDIFLQASNVDQRGYVYGIGNLNETDFSKKRKYEAGNSSSSYVSMQQQLQETQRKLDEQAAQNKRLEAELARQKAQGEELTLMDKYLRQTDQGYLAFLASQTAPTDPQTAATTDTTTTDTTPAESL